MRTTHTAATDPWGTSIDDAWRDLVVSSAPPPPPPRDEAAPKNPALPADIKTWQEHGAAARTAVVEEPSFSAGDRRLWVVAGALMALAVLVLGLLGYLTFGGNATAAREPAAAPTMAAAEPTATPARHSNSSHVASATVATRSAATSPRLLKRTKRARHHKRIASR